MSNLAHRLRYELHRAVDLMLEDDIASLNAYAGNDAIAQHEADANLLDAKAVVTDLRRAHTSEVVEGKGL